MATEASTGRHPIRRAFEMREPDAIAPLLAPGVVLHSPVTGVRDFVGAQEVGDLLRALVEEYEDWECVHELRDGDRTVLVTRARIGGRPVDIVDVLSHDSLGRICEVQVTGRPLSGVAAFTATVGPRLAQRRGRLRAQVVRVAAAPLPGLLSAVDRIGTSIALGRRPLARSVEIGAPIEAVFAYVADARNDMQWCDCVEACDLRGGDAGGVGARYEARHRPVRLRRSLTRSIVVLEHDPPRRVRWRQEDDDASFDITYDLEPTARGTRLTQTNVITWRFGPAQRPFAVPFARALVRRRLAQQLAALKAQLEQPPEDQRA